jgi:hypothetical protein
LGLVDRIAHPGQIHFGDGDGLKEGNETVGAFSAPAVLWKNGFWWKPNSPA